MNSRVKTPWLKAVHVEPLANQRLYVRRKDGSEWVLDLTAPIRDRDAYWRLRQERYFKQVALDPLGGICWPEGEDLAPDGWERYAEERVDDTSAQGGPTD